MGETKRNVLNMKFYFWLTFIASDHLASGQGGRYRPLLNRAYQNLQREAAKPPPPPPPHDPNYRHGNSYTHKTAPNVCGDRPSYSLRKDQTEELRSPNYPIGVPKLKTTCSWYITSPPDIIITKRNQVKLNLKAGRTG